MLLLLLACTASFFAYSVQEEYPALSEVLAEVESKYSQRAYYDPATQLTIEYNLFLPDNYTSSKQYPLVVFIPDASSVGKGPLYALELGYGGVIWATAYEQSKHEAIVLVPTYNTTIIDDNHGYTTTLYIDATKNLIEEIATLYTVDVDRIYCTGQSMGCMTFLLLSSAYPKLFAAELFVSGQWRLEELVNLTSQKFFYIVAGGDQKASAGQEEVYTFLTAQQVPVTRVKDLDAQMTNTQFASEVANMLANNTDINMFNFLTGTVLNGTTTKTNPTQNEHMASFNCAYRIEAVRDWLFTQRRSQ